MGTAPSSPPSSPAALTSRTPATASPPPSSNRSWTSPKSAIALSTRESAPLRLRPTALARFFLDDLLQREAAALEFGLNRGETCESRFTEPVALDLGGDRRRSL